MKQGWEYKKLGEVCEIYQPKTISTDKLVENGRYKVYGANGTVGFYNEYNHVEKEILLTCRGATCGTINVSEPYSWINGNAMVIHRKDDSIDFSFLKYHMQSIDYSLIITGAAQPQITRQMLSPVSITLPPLSKQQAIVAELDKINEIIDLKKAQLKDLDLLAQSIFYNMFGDPIENPKGWEVKKLGDIASFKNGLNFGKNEQGYNYKLLGVSDFKVNSTVSSDSLGIVSLTSEISNEYLLKNNDIVFVRSNGSKELVGRCVLLNVFEDTTFSGFCIRCRIENNDVVPIFLLTVLKTDCMRAYLTQSGQGCNISNLNQKILSSTQIPLPPLPLQQSFAEKIQTIESQKSAIKQSLAETETLLASRMDYYFN